MRIQLRWKRGSVSDAALERENGRKGGYTFVEVLISFGIVGFVGASLCGAFSAGFCMIQMARENLRATQILVQKTEAVRLFTWSQVGDTTNYLKSIFVVAYDPQGGTSDGTGAQYTGFVTASVPPAGDLPEAYRTNMRTITVSLYWTNYNGGKPIVHEREIQTRVARNGMQNYIWGAL